ncbi:MULTISPECIES: CCRG-2 family RiPP [unclassified Bradyrhizobium]|uniref:CCRG-2 family RiPP n=1 Tax=unclassified Bradyrhizobium TaxID=2631580 RepID=UPI0020B37C23|nr:MULTISPECIES: CCRG-2 family RiPP [unclassified Bradyrhizobium]MCP3381293.1 CCRG-2 family RiPP [Bradyrhizobium sp. CCGUVB4N]MCP3442381.1 CCRG-2 family RiPP [Bradyrhizobium sp. CCGUVB14]WFU79075.1 CCRG-2 family RiPP [Bradyrhizobium sp. CIAT3101]
MTVSTKPDFANCELSIDELEAVAGGGLWGWIKHEASDALHWVEKNAGSVASVIEKVLGGPVYNSHPPHKMS